MLQCENCGRKITRDNAVKTETGYACKSCIAEEYIKCDICGTYLNFADTLLVHGNGFDFKHICHNPKCAEHYIKCDECGMLLTEENIFTNEYGEHLCRDCYRSENEVIKEYHSLKQIKFYGDTNPNALYMGVELEIDNGDDSEQTALEFYKLFPRRYLHCEDDGSLTDGFECITQPSTYEYYMSNIDKFHQMFQIAKSNGFCSHNTSTCGLHIHINRNYFGDNSDMATKRLLYLFQKFETELTKFSRRNRQNLNRWASFYNASPSKVLDLYYNGGVSRYHAINLTNKNTIEFRLFRGTLKLETFIATLQLVKSLVNIAKNTTDRTIQLIKWRDILATDNEINKYWERVKDRDIV